MYVMTIGPFMGKWSIELKSINMDPFMGRKLKKKNYRTFAQKQ